MADLIVATPFAREVLVFGAHPRDALLNALGSSAQQKGLEYGFRRQHDAFSGRGNTFLCFPHPTTFIAGAFGPTSALFHAKDWDSYNAASRTRDGRDAAWISIEAWVELMAEGLSDECKSSAPAS